MTHSKPKRDIYQEVTDKMIAMIEAGAGQWEKPWIAAGNGARPLNAKSGKPYRGINVPLLWQRDGSPYWATFKQWKDLGAKVRKGERATMVVFWKEMTDQDEKGEPVARADGRKFFLLRHYNVFNVDQVDGWQAPAVELPNEAERIAAADRLLQATRAKIRLNGGRAYYSPAGDYIGMPGFEHFKATATASATENAYSTLLHELTHWTGHESRCDRDFSGRFGSEAYGFEELVAELGSAFLCADLGISRQPRRDHAQYLQSWLKVLKGDKRAIFTAASKAQQACDFLQDLQPGAPSPAPKGPGRPKAPRPAPAAPKPAPKPVPVIDQRPAGHCTLGGRKVAMPWAWSEGYKRWLRRQEMALNAPTIPDRTKRHEQRARDYALWLARRDGVTLPDILGECEWAGADIKAVRFGHELRVAIPNHDWRPRLEYVNDWREAA